MSISLSTAEWTVSFLALFLVAMALAAILLAKLNGLNQLLELVQ